MTWVIGNWKSNGTVAQQQAFAEILNDRVINPSTQVAICPPITLLYAFQQSLTNSAIRLGAQNISATESGAYTGELSAPMLKDSGATVVIIGHSERREYYQEITPLLAAKFQQAVISGLRPIFCIGEPLSARQSGEATAFIRDQIDSMIALTGINNWVQAIVAYEPIWAIGTGETAAIEQISDMHRHIRDTFSKHSATIARTLPILYGGSVKPSNASSIFSIDNVDGGLIGGASLNTDDFCQLIAAAEQCDQAE